MPLREHNPVTMDLNDILDAWKANCVINHEFLGLCADEDFELKPGNGKTIRSNFVHIVGVRLGYLEDKLRKETAHLPKLDWKTATREEIASGLNATDGLMERLFEIVETAKKPARWTTARFFAYNIAHEAHHRSQIEIALRVNGREPPVSSLYELWEWPKK